MLNLKALLAKILQTDLVIEQSKTADGWYYKKYASGYLEAVRVRNVGQVTLNTVEVSPIRVGGNITSAPPSMARSGSIDVSLMGNTSNSPVFIERIATNSWRIAKVTTTSATLQNVTVCERTIGARWK